jgi:hypothetical protein
MVMEILMTIDEFLQAIKKTAPPAPTHKLAQLEVALGVLLPEDCSGFLQACNGGYVGGSLWYKGPTPAGDPAEAGVHPIGGFREESYFSLERARECYAGRIPDELLWIMDDPFGNAIFLEYEEPIRATSTFGITRWSPTQTVGTVKSIPQERVLDRWLLHRIRGRSKADCRRMIKRRSTANPASYIVQFCTEMARPKRFELLTPDS